MNRDEQHMNIYQVAPEVFRFRLWNLLAAGLGFDGHFTLWWHRPSGRFVMGKHGGYGSLTWFPEEKPKPVVPTPEQGAFLQPIIDRELHGSYFYDGDKKNSAGAFLSPEVEARFKAGEYIPHNGRLVFQQDSTWKQTPEERAVDETAIRMLDGNRTRPLSSSAAV